MTEYFSLANEHGDDLSPGSPDYVEHYVRVSRPLPSEYKLAQQSLLRASASAAELTAEELSTADKVDK